MRKFKYLLFVLVLLMILIVGYSLFKKEDNKSILIGDSFVTYFAPTYTDISYGSNDAKLVQFDKSGNINTYDETAYPFSSMINYKNEVIYQTNKGISKLNSKDIDEDLLKDKKTISYGMSDLLGNKDLFYFLTNESLKEDYYSSNLIIGNNDKRSLHQIEGFVNSFGNDENDIYLLTSDMKDKASLQLQKISVTNQSDIKFKKETLNFNTTISANNRMIVLKDYIYSFITKEEENISLLKISKDTLKINKTFEFKKFNGNENNDKYHNASESSIFFKDDKIYYIALSGVVYSFDINTEKFKEEFKVKDYMFEDDSNLLSYYSSKESKIYFLYYESSIGKYKMDSYTLDGVLEDTVTLEGLDFKNNEYPHSFIKIE